jgi:hypothetical protein
MIILLSNLKALILMLSFKIMVFEQGRERKFYLIDLSITKGSLVLKEFTWAAIAKMKLIFTSYITF